MENKERNENMVDRFQFISPICIAGPCSAETEEQVLKIAHELKGSDVCFRAGIWKPPRRI
jgi:chorismate mutase